MMETKLESLTRPEDLRTAAFKFRRNNPSSVSHDSAAMYIELSADRIEQLRQRVQELETQLAKNNPLLDEAANRIDAMENYIDDVCTVICDPYKWCDDMDVLRRIEKLLRDGAKLLGDAK